MYLFGILGCVLHIKRAFEEYICTRIEESLAFVRMISPYYLVHFENSVIVKRLAKTIDDSVEFIRRLVISYKLLH